LQFALIRGGMRRVEATPGENLTAAQDATHRAAIVLPTGALNRQSSRQCIRIRVDDPPNDLNEANHLNGLNYEHNYMVWPK
jgi:hypothetical protein